MPKQWKYKQRDGYSNNLGGNYFNDGQITDYEPIVKKFPEWFTEVITEKTEKIIETKEKVINIIKVEKEYIIDTSVPKISDEMVFIDTTVCYDEDYSDVEYIIDDIEDNCIDENDIYNFDVSQMNPLKVEKVTVDFNLTEDVEITITETPDEQVEVKEVTKKEKKSKPKKTTKKSKKEKI